MKKLTMLGLLLAAVALIVTAGCGGGGGGTPPPPQPTTAQVKILTSGTLPPDTLIGGIDIIITLPPGVTVVAQSEGSKMVPVAGVIELSGAAIDPAVLSASATATYEAATSTTPGRILIYAVSTGFTTGEFVTVKCDIAVGSFPQPSGFSLSGFVSYDDTTGGDTPLADLTPGFTAVIQ